MLRDGRLDPQRAQQVETELLRRFQDQFSPPPDSIDQRQPMPDAYRQQTPGPNPTRWVGPPPGVGGPQPARPQPARRSRTAPSVIALVVVAVAVLGLVFALRGGADDEPLTPTTGTRCFTPEGDCPLAAAAPIGGSCYCPDSFGYIHYGSVG
ncbi:MAG TPA: hypothetical protein VIU11_19640 [Nakamurella sp.]